jgi:hypothetical protein
VFSAIATCITDTYLRISPVAADFDGSVSNLILIKLANHAVAPSDAARPNLRLDGNGRWYLDRDTTDDNLPITWPTVLSESQLGPELVTNGTFPTNADGWMASANATVAWSSGKLQLSAAAAYPKVTQPITLSVGKYYEIIVDLEYVDAPLWVMVSSADTLTPDRQFSVIQYTSNTKFRLVFKSTIATAYVGVSLETTSAGKLGYIDNVSVREATGTNVIYTATGDYTTKDSGLILSGATDYKYPQRPSGDYGRIVMAAESKYDAKIIKYLDQKRGRSYLLGPELVTNGGFDSATWWATSGEVTISGGVATIASTGASAVLNRNSLLTATKVYLITFSVVWRSGLGKLEASGGSTHTLIGASGTYSAILSGSTNLVFNRVSACSFDLDNISVREILL